MGDKNYDVIVLGVGSMGSATCYYLAKQGIKVLGIEQYGISHELGSHGGQSRIIRQAYFEHADYVPLLKRAYENWQLLENESNEQLVHKTGLLYLGKSNHHLIKGTLASAAEHKLQVDKLTAETMAERYPQFNLPDDYDYLFEANAGFVTPEKTIQQYAKLTVNHGGKINTSEKVLGWQKDGTTITVKTSKASYSCNKLVITAGPWAGKLMPQLARKLKITRQVIAWLNPSKPDMFDLEKFPSWTLDDDEHEGIFYGFPILPAQQFGSPTGLKLGYHHPGMESDPDKLDRSVTDEDRAVLLAMLAKFIPDAYGSIVELKTCMYTNTADANFIIDYLPDHDNVVFATGFSGHGFKFAPVVGEILSGLVLEGATPLPIEFLRADRPALHT